VPAPVDHEARRRFVISKTADLIASSGIDATSVRTVAKAAGYSTSIVTHYFEDKAHLLTATYLDVVARRQARLLAVSLDGEDPLRSATIAMLPMDAASRAEWAVYCAFLGSAVGIKSLASIQAQSIDRSSEILAMFVRRDIEKGRMPKATVVEEATHDLIVCVTGIGVVAMLDPNGRGPDSAIADIDRALSRLRGGPHAVGSRRPRS
jgi:AcrR family transcriptional regulator